MDCPSSSGFFEFLKREFIGVGFCGGSVGFIDDGEGGETSNR